MNKSNSVPLVLEKYQQGQRYFQDLDMENESFEGQNLEDITFENCSLYISFRKANLRNAKFINGGIKTCDFREADLTNAWFENAQFARAKTDNIYFDNNSAYGHPVTKAHFDEWIKDYEDEPKPFS